MFWQSPHRDQLMYLKHFIQVNCFNHSLAFQLRSSAHASFSAYIFHLIKDLIIYLLCHVSYHSFIVGYSLACFRALFRSCPGTQCLQESKLEQWRMMGKDAVSLCASFNNNSNFITIVPIHWCLVEGQPLSSAFCLIQTNRAVGLMKTMS